MGKEKHILSIKEKEIIAEYLPLSLNLCYLVWNSNSYQNPQKWLQCIDEATGSQSKSKLLKSQSSKRCLWSWVYLSPKPMLFPLHKWFLTSLYPKFSNKKYFMEPLFLSWNKQYYLPRHIIKNINIFPPLILETNMDFNMQILGKTILEDIM